MFNVDGLLKGAIESELKKIDPKEIAQLLINGLKDKAAALAASDVNKNGVNDLADVEAHIATITSEVEAVINIIKEVEALTPKK